ncbi:DUF6538 domain-containing protein [Tabrizicola sp.]|uniref:DUF6538 domain-containing protein n=1 Tax=Tabrizicola sp. TaxID=2005166 RepID=UPI0035B4AB53
MARKVRYLLERDGRYYARLVVPVHLRSYLEGKTELRVPLGADYREATKAIHGAVADLQFRSSRLKSERPTRASDHDLRLRLNFPQSRWPCACIESA